MATILGAGRYFGFVVGRRRTGALTVTETRYVSGEEIPRHRHEQAYFCFVVRGGYRERSGGGETDCAADAIVFHPESAGHADRFGERGGVCFNLECERGWLADCGSGLERLVAPLYLADADAAWLARRLRREALTAGAHSDLALAGLARAVVAAVASYAGGAGAPPGPPWFRSAVELAEHEFAAAPGLSELARRVGVHPTHLARAFRRHLGCTLGELVRRRRVEAASRLLVQTDRSLSRIAYETGFADQSHFTRTFRRHAGMTPAEYRRSAQAR